MNGDSRKAFFFPRKRSKKKSFIVPLLPPFPALTSCDVRAMSAILGLRGDSIRVKVQQLRMVKLKGIQVADDTAALEPAPSNFFVK